MDYNCQTESAANSLIELATEHEQRAWAYEVACKKLGRSAAAAPELSAPEWDALRLTQLSRGCQEATKVVTEKAKEATELITKSMTTTADSTFAMASPRTVLKESTQSASNAPTNSTVHDWLLNMRSYLEQAMRDQAIVTKEALSERAETIRVGTKLWNGGASATVLAKKSAMDAALLDSELLLNARAALNAFQEVAFGLRAAQSELENPACASLAGLAEAYEERAKVYGEVIHLLRQPAAALELTAPEWDALRLAQLGRGCQVATQAVAESTKDAAEHASRGVTIAARRARKECC